MKSISKQSNNAFLNKVLNGDAVEMMKTLPDNSVDLVVTSPHMTLFMITTVITALIYMRQVNRLREF